MNTYLCVCVCPYLCMCVCICVMKPTPLFPHAPLCTQMRAPLLVHSIPFSFLPDTPFLSISVIPASPFLLTQMLFSKASSGNLFHSLFCYVTLVYSFVLALLCSRSALHAFFFFSFLFHLEFSEGRGLCWFNLVPHFVPSTMLFTDWLFQRWGEELGHASVRASWAVRSQAWL